MKNSRIELTGMEPGQVIGGMVWGAPGDKELSEMGLSDCVHCAGGWWDTCYNILDSDGEWNKVGSEGMLRYVEKTFGRNSAQFRRLYAYCFCA